MRRWRRVILVAAAFAAAAALGIALNLVLLGGALQGDDPVGRLTPVSGARAPAAATEPAATTATTAGVDDDDRGPDEHGGDDD